MLSSVLRRSALRRIAGARFCSANAAAWTNQRFNAAIPVGAEEDENYVYNYDPSRLPDIQKTNYTYPRAWKGADVEKDKAFYTFSPQAQREIRELVKNELVPRHGDDVDKARIDRSKIPTVVDEMQEVERILQEYYSFVVFNAIEGLETITERRYGSFVQTGALGDLLVQNAEGVKAILVYDRDRTKKMSQGQRYHQSREGGSIHTDNVNVPYIWEYMILTCLQPGRIGGESILCSSLAVHNYLRDNAPEVLETLRQPFWWEYRGFNEKFYRAPIVFYNQRGEPMIRYLRDYMESAYIRKNISMSHEQRYALDYLDSLLELSEMQFRHQLSAGQSVFCFDTQVLHGRTSFVDSGETTGQYDFENPRNRLYQRTWLTKDGWLAEKLNSMPK